MSTISSFAKAPNALLQLACGPAEWRRLIKAADEGGSPLWKDWLRENYFQSVAWRNKQTERLQIDGGKCACCGKARSVLEVHHKSEANFGDEDVVADLETRCRACHAEVELEGRLGPVVEDAEMLRSMKESLRLFTRDTEKRVMGRSAIAMLG
jgi:hypothetical protein